MCVAAIIISIRFLYLVTTAANITLYSQIHKFSEDYFRYLSPHKVLEAKNRETEALTDLSPFALNSVNNRKIGLLLLSREKSRLIGQMIIPFISKADKIKKRP